MDSKLRMAAYGVGLFCAGAFCSAFYMTVAAQTQERLEQEQALMKQTLLEMLQAQPDRGQVTVSAVASPECETDKPLRVTVTNGANRRLLDYTAWIHAYQPGYSDIRESFRHQSARIIDPGAAVSWCYAYPDSIYGDLSGMEWRGSSFYAAFERVSPAGTGTD